MRIGISNICFGDDLRADFLLGLRDAGAQGIEVAPTKIASWDALSARVVTNYRSRVDDAGLVVPSMQALLYGTETPHLLRAEANFLALVDHLKFVAEIAGYLGADLGVFGSPKHRDLGGMDPDEAWLLATDRLLRLGEAMIKSGFKLAIEPVPAAYGGDFLIDYHQVVKMVRDLDHPGIVVHLDTACVTLGGDEIGDAVLGAGPSLKHFHIAEPELGNFSSPGQVHSEAASALASVEYAGWGVVEMRGSGDDWEQCAIEAIRFASSSYKL